MALKFVIIPTNEVTDEMRAASPIEHLSPDGSKTVFDYSAEKPQPSCYADYDELSSEEWYKLWDDSEGIEFWSPVPEELK
tara:strand:+ start:754 stop:993 length:240 start_codon:yes stop_codon:yes gene_type:complete